MTDHRIRYGFSVMTAMPYGDAVARTRTELASEGFGVLTEIDVAATMKKKLGVDFRPYLIIGACNPPLAHRALEAELDIGLLLPCNVVVYAANEPGRTIVAAMDPEAAMDLAGNPAIGPIAREAATRLRRALERVAANGGARA